MGGDLVFDGDPSAGAHFTLTVPLEAATRIVRVA